MATLTSKATAAQVDIKQQLKAINGALDEFVASVRIGASTVVRKVAADVLARIIRLTPVDTGRLRAGWAVAARALRIPISTFGAKKAKPGAVAQGVAAGSFEERSTQTRYTVVMANGVRYAPFIEAGWSRKAPRGMVRVSLEAARTKLVQDLRAVKTKGTK